MGTEEKGPGQKGRRIVATVCQGGPVIKGCHKPGNTTPRGGNTTGEGKGGAALVPHAGREGGPETGEVGGENRGWGMGSSAGRNKRKVLRDAGGYKGS